MLLDLSKLEPLEKSYYRLWSKKLLIFFKQLEVDYIHTVDRSCKGKSVVEIDSSSSRISHPLPSDKSSSKSTNLLQLCQFSSKPVVDTKKFAKHTKIVCGHLHSHMTRYVSDSKFCKGDMEHSRVQI